MERNIVTHAHSDHARPGHHSYLATIQSLPLLKARLAKKIKVQTLDYGEEISMNGVKVSLHPAGHVFGSAQVRVEYKGEVWVITGDYKLEDDQLSEPFEPIKCHTFVTECTFGLPVYRWPDQFETYKKINQWWKENRNHGITSLLFGYSLGKSQRVIRNVDPSIGEIYVHKSVDAMNKATIAGGGWLPESIVIDEDMPADKLKGSLIIAPPSFTSGRMVQGIGPISTAMASGWVQTGRNFGGGSSDIGFVMSDHVDWDGILKAITLTEPDTVVTMHGYTKELTRYLNETGQHSIELDDLKFIPHKL